MRKLALFAALCLVLTGCGIQSGQSPAAKTGAETVQTTEAGQTQTEAGQTQTETGQTQTEAGQTQTEASQTQTEADQPQTDAGQTQTEADQPQTDVGQTVAAESAAPQDTDRQEDALQAEEVTEAAVEEIHAGGADADNTGAENADAMSAGAEDMDTENAGLEGGDMDLPDIEVVDTEGPAGGDGTVSGTALTLTVYAPDDTAEGFVTTEVEVTSLDADTLAEQLILAGALAEGTEVKSFSQSEDGAELSVEWNEAFRKHVMTMGTSGEYLILGSVVNTFLEAYGAQTIELTVEGEPLETGHNIYDQPMGFYEEL